MADEPVVTSGQILTSELTPEPIPSPAPDTPESILSIDLGKKTEEPAKEPEPRAPAEYTDFNFPEGVTLDDQGLTDFKSFAKEQDLTQEQAQKILEWGSQKLLERSNEPQKAWKELNDKWRADVKADAEIGGTKFEDSIKNASLVFTPGESNPFVKTADEAQALRDALNVTGAGNNPAVVKLFVKMGRMLSEPGSLTGKPAARRPEEILNSFYNNS